MDSNNNNDDTLSNPLDDDLPIEPSSTFDNDMTPIEDETRGRPLVWLLLGVIAIGCGVLFAAAFVFFQPNMKSLTDEYFPSPTPTFTHTPTATPSITPTPTRTGTPTPNTTATVRAQQTTQTAVALQATAVYAASNWKLQFLDNFDDNSNEHYWRTEKSNDEYASTDFKIENEKYHWDATAHQGFVTWADILSIGLKDFYMNIEVQQLNGPATSSRGVLFRKGAKGYYYFHINDLKQFGLDLWYQDNWTTIIDSTHSSAIQVNEPNQITVIAEGDHFMFFINGQFVIETTLDKIKQGTTAIAIELRSANDQATFEFDNIELRTPK